jgi:hypothetical protein
MAKRKTLFEEYAFEVGVLTLPAYLVLIAFGVFYMGSREGTALLLVGAVGCISALGSLKMGYKDIKW